MGQSFPKMHGIIIQGCIFASKATKKKTLGIASAFMKRVLSDYRGLWWPLNLGYSYQAACVAASLYENALLVDCLSDDERLCEIAMNAKGGDIPWGALKLSKMAAQKDLYNIISKKNQKVKNMNMLGSFVIKTISGYVK